jgi:acyl-CoA synthetase (AMP-forming)/AMP-acid ligase II
MDGMAARHERDKILAELRTGSATSSGRFPRQSPNHPALVQGDVTWTYAELAAVIADTTVILKLYDIRAGDRVMIVSENSLALAALILATSDIDIIRSGFNVYPSEVEAVLNEHPAVAPSAVIGRAVPGNEEVVAYVQLLPGSAATSAELLAHAARLLAPYKRPSEIVVVDALPTASTGKILKHRLAAEARDGPIARV